MILIEHHVMVKVNNISRFFETRSRFLSDPCAHGVRSLGSNVCTYKSFLKPCEDLVKTVNVVNVVKI